MINSPGGDAHDNNNDDHPGQFESSVQDLSISKINRFNIHDQDDEEEDEEEDERTNKASNDSAATEDDDEDKRSAEGEHKSILSEENKIDESVPAVEPSVASTPQLALESSSQC